AAVNLVERRGGKQQRPFHARQAQSLLDVTGGLGGGQGAQLRQQRDALPQGSQLRLQQQGRQLRLAAQDDLQQLLAVRVHVGKQPDILQQVHCQQMSLVDQEHGGTALALGFQKQFVEGQQAARLGGGGNRHFKFVQQRLQELLAGEHRIHQES